MRLGVLDPFFQDLLSLLDELSVQIDGVCLNTPAGVILTEDELRRLSVVLLHLAAVCLSLLGELLGAGAIAARVGVLGLVSVSGDEMTETAIAIAIVIERLGLWWSHTRLKHCPRLEASWRARSRSRSYSASASVLLSWLKAGVVSDCDGMEQLTHYIPRGPMWDISCDMIAMIRRTPGEREGCVPS